MYKKKYLLMVIIIPTIYLCLLILSKYDSPLIRASVTSQADIPIVYKNRESLIDVIKDEELVDELLNSAVKNSGTYPEEESLLRSIYIEARKVPFIKTSFKTNVLINKDKSRIISYDAPASKTILGGLSINEEFEIKNKYYDISQAAWISYSFTWKVIGNYIEPRYSLNAYIKDDDYWATFTDSDGKNVVYSLADLIAFSKIIIYILIPLLVIRSLIKKNS